MSLLSKEELDDALLVLEAQSGFGAKVRAHIDALEAELDQAKSENDRLLLAAERMLAAGDALANNRDEWKRRAESTLAQAEALEKANAALEADNAARQAALSGVVNYLHIVQADMGGNHRYALMPGHGPALAHAQHVESQPHPGAAVGEWMKRLEAFAKVGLAAYHGYACRLAGKIRPENPAECEDPMCRGWAKALEGA